ncbi:hypothetical protein [Agromyces humatus]|uniref:hypothetical protein n=1 Tax=Agromyces humatus TaxID=279573 RepID=UPI001E4C0F39|nr:hypothetical protein [Agromyces humatus]
MLGAPAGATSLGVFEPLRGRIVYVAGDELRAIDPADPSSVASVAVPDELRDKGPVVAGWSADGTRLALTTEGSDGKGYVMNAEGGITQARSELGCCTFVREPWLAPDGTTVLDLITAEQISLRDLERGGPSRIVELDPPVAEGLQSWFIPIHAWSPDGTRIAYTVDQQFGVHVEPSVYLVDLDTGATRELVGPGFGHIRHMTWSPDGSRLLVVAGPWRASTIPTELNPLTLPQETALYPISTDSSTPAASPSTLSPLTSGHYIAATWSPDGDQIAAIDFGPSGRHLVVMRADGSASRVLVTGMGWNLFTGLAWHPIPSDR